MAVVQISRIQLRRGKKNAGSGLPQLASGELAWCVDTQELYVGNGAVGEGAPAVGNTKILTFADTPALLDLIEYTYKLGDSIIQTGESVNFPVIRPLQDRLDDYVNSADYGITSGSSDQTDKIQHLVNNLFLSNKITGVKSRVVLSFQPGEYTFSDTIYIPSHVRIEGAGKDRTIFNFTGTGAAFSFVNDNSTVGNPDGLWNSNTGLSTIDNTTYITQPKFCYLKGFTLNTTDETAIGLQLNAVRDSVFDDIAINGGFINDPGTFTNTGIGLYGFTDLVTCQRNLFYNVTVNGFQFTIYSKYDIINNQFISCNILDAQCGIYFGKETGQLYGPRNNIIKNCYFTDIRNEGIYIDFGTGNRSIGNTFVEVGYANTNNFNIIKFVRSGNTSTNDTFDRIGLSSPSSSIYRQEVTGKVYYEQLETREVTLVRQTTFTDLIRIPYNTRSGIEITYLLDSADHVNVRRGKLNIAVNSTTDTVQLVDEYEYISDGISEIETNISSNITFDAITSPSTGTIIIQYKNTEVGNNSNMTYSYRFIS